MTWRRSWLLVQTAVLLACGGREAPAPPRGPSAVSAVATVADVTISGPLISAVAGAQGLAPREALRTLVEDALAARGGLDRGLDRDPAVSWAFTVALARRSSERLAADARALGPPTDDELDAVTVVHAVVLRSSTLPEDAALAAATALAQGVEGARTAEDFLARAKAIQRPHVRVVAEQVGPFTIDGLTLDGHELDKTFVAAAFSLRLPQETSRIVASSFGWHVLRLVGRSRPAGAPDERRQALAEPAIEARTRVRLADVLFARRQRTKVEISGDADSLMAAETAAP